MNRIEKKFQSLAVRKQKAFIAFLTAGDPSLRKTEELAFAFDKAGVDIIELGVPFSDPLADGPTIQAASYRALQNGTNLPGILTSVKNIRKWSQMPIALMTYYNPVFHFGEKQFAAQAKASGVDGLIIPDLPVEEAGGLIAACRENDVATVFFLSPTTTPARAKKIMAAATGFIYYVSLAGVTGARAGIPADLLAKVRQAKRLTAKPICVGFGISQPDQVRRIATIADGVIVGSAIVNRVAQTTGQNNQIQSVRDFVATLLKPLRSPTHD
ncbi:MAG: tryptophan synthase subunit alpha [Candidatus Omnitrophica bacterium]|nr:tryptophan synthase subunit alpha [Candidatus Omnitrophota bacterium]